MLNGMIGGITLFTVFGKAPQVVWWVVFGYCVIVFLLGAVCTSVSEGKGLTGWQERVAHLTYTPSIFLGKARIVYSIVFLFGIFCFYATQAPETIVLIIFWGIFMALYPLGIPELISRLRKNKISLMPSGRVIRTEAPNIVRAILESSNKWSTCCLKRYQQSDAEQYYVVPLFAEEHGDSIIGTGLCTMRVEEEVPGLMNGCLYDAGIDTTEEQIAFMLGGGKGSALVGFVVEDSRIETLRFQTLDAECCKGGMTVWCKLGNAKVYYQLIEGVTKEESIETNRHGYQIAVASQLGLLIEDRGFTKYEWLPPMNAPVFAVSQEFGSDCSTVKEGDFSYGNVPGTSFAVGGAFADMIEYHTAILGITGSGKTELAFDLIHHAVNSETKVICVDLTQRYEGRLSDLNPYNLSLSPDLSRELGDKLFKVETGRYGAPEEKEALGEFSERLREDISKNVKDFIESQEENSRLGIITLNEISNTKATIYVTELFLSCVLHYARDHSATCPRILIVLEEAHTVVPEASTMGLGDFESKGLVAKIAQIALQGRKYGVGLLVIAQRTATVSKTVLTQCNTFVSFTCICTGSA